ncbi:Uncharacterised protein [Listeria fleischmannii subsp. fleischmannii]|uniref:Uncharacterized protein n=1 Tax=Listeria fleischmannii subsp. fleischmannii TaxID=1671902 RepID=A0A2X3J8J6_9LIST|nr:hypothetical protein [Listeria fleischmannii]SQC69379.1 Uncharacterised protein [Listeria fleischmannii subsp. fleischmannii]
MKRRQLFIVAIFILTLTSISFGCSTANQTVVKKEESEVVKPFPTSKQKFVRVVGWLTMTVF